MHTIEPFYRWGSFYSPVEDEHSPFYGKEYVVTAYTQSIYDHYIHPYWDFIGSETLYIKLLFANYSHGVAIIEFIGEWNDTLYNDVMHLKRNIIDHLVKKGIQKFILIGENIMNFHGSDDCYYEEWFDDLEEGWIAAVNFRDFVRREMSSYSLDFYINFGGKLDEMDNWRTMQPMEMYKKVQSEVGRRIDLV